ncbi:MAG: CYTH domain-containing protein [Planctomycetaceae bacterium]|nr:CYTH domain-containing protein [Planctomycetaceae bacterium]
MRSTVGIRGVVSKQRDLFMIGPTRIHLDQVADLGSFLELEVVLQPEQTLEQGQEVANMLMAELGIGADHLVSHAYIDLLEAREA